MPKKANGGGVQGAFDAAAFEEVCLRAEKAGTPEEAAEVSYALLPFCEALIAIRKNASGTAEAFQADQDRYVAAACKLCEVFQAQNKQSDILMAMTAAAKVNPLSKQVYHYMFHALKALSMRKAIVTTYHRMERTLAEALGEAPDEELTAIYREASADLDEKEEDLLVIKDELKTVQQENYEDEGPMVCTYEVLKYLFQILSRTNERTAMRSVVWLMSLSPMEGCKVQPEQMAAAMLVVRDDVLMAELRRSDTVAKYSTNQFVIMLSVAKEENALGAKARIVAHAARVLDKFGLQAEFSTATPGSA